MSLKDTFVHDFGKFKMVLDSNDNDVSLQIKEHGWYVDEQFDIQILHRYLKEGMTFVDLGANVGFYTFVARSLVGDKGRVFAFEPFPRNAQLIRASIRENSFTNVTIVEAAVSDRNGKASFHLSPDANSEHSLLDLDFKYNGQQRPAKIDVDLVTIDSFFEKNVGDKKVDFIKMDIEGSEYEAVKGMKKILENNRHLVLLAEFWPNGFRKGGHDPYEFLNSLSTSGFSIHIIDSLANQVSKVSIDELKRLEHSRSTDPKLQNKVMQVWGWYTNLLCYKDQ
jgi:FkbM family methyltransferase